MYVCMYVCMYVVAHDGGHSSIYPYYRAVIFKIATEEEILEFSS